MNSFGKLIFSLFISVAISVANAQTSKMDITTHDALIANLESVLPSQKNDKKQYVTLQIRLADVYAERARLKDLSEIDSKSDRQKAISYYIQVRKNADNEQLKTVLLQLAHLYRVLGDNKKSKKTHLEILKNKKLKSIHYKANMGLAEMAFQIGEMAQAQSLYQKAKPYTQGEDLVYISYRLAWTLTNLGKPAEALVQMRAAISLAVEQNLNSFHKDLIRDYATMLGRQQFTEKDINQFITLSPAKEVSENLKFLGEEADRLGNKKGSLLIWTQYLAHQDTNQKDKAEAQLRIAQNFFDLNKPIQSIDHLNEVIRLVKDNKCDNCEDVKKDFKNFLVSWSKKEKSAPSNNLLSAFQLYLVMSENDYEAVIWAGQIARSRGDFQAAQNLYERAALISHKNKDQQNLENALTVSIEMAEQSKNDTTYASALLQYLNLNPSGKLADDARYQLAFLKYKNKDYSGASEALRIYALDSRGKRNLRLQAADLCLDSFAQLKNEIELRSHAETFAQNFKEKFAVFTEISRKVTVNLIVTELNAIQPEESKIKSELNRLAKYDLATLNNKDKITHLRTQILAAERIKDLNLLLDSSERILKIKSLPRDSENLAQKSLLWIYELRLDFKNAYQLAKKMPMPQLRKDQRALRLGLLAELAQLNPTTHFNEFIKLTKSTESANQVRLKLIRRHNNSWAQYDKYFSQLRKSPALLAEITLELHLNKPSLQRVKKAMALRAVASTSDGRYMNNLLLRKDIQRDTAKLTQHRLNKSNDKALKKSINERIKYLTQLKSIYQRAQKRSDLVAQFDILKIMSAQNSRFHRELVSLPAPRGLKKVELVMYKQLLQKQAEPFLIAAQETQKTSENLLSANSKTIEELVEAYTSETLLSRAIAKNEFTALKTHLNKRQISQFTAANSNKVIPAKTLQKARHQVAKNPLDLNTLEELRELEARQGNGPLIAYLDERLSLLKKTVRR